MAWAQIVSGRFLRSNMAHRIFYRKENEFACATSYGQAVKNQ